MIPYKIYECEFFGSTPLPIFDDYTPTHPQDEKH